MYVHTSIDGTHKNVTVNADMSALAYRNTHVRKAYLEHSA